jgi:DNA mismatch repair protein MutS
MSDETPLLKQYRAVKAEYPDAIVMFRIGDFFEMFEADAETAARELELTLTSKAMGKAGRLPLAGVPFHAAENYIARLVRKGYHVAVCDQTEDPKKAKGLVRREVVRVVTPGTWTGGSERENRFLGAIMPLAASKNSGKLAGEESRRVAAGLPNVVDGFAASFGDLLTGEFYTASSNPPSARGDLLETLLARFRPTEILLPDDAGGLKERIRAALPSAAITPVPAWRFGASRGADLLKAHFGVATLEGFGWKEENAEEGAAGALLEYLKETQKSTLAHVTSIARLNDHPLARIDAATLLQLEIIDSPTGDHEATLLAIMDQAVTAMGSRLIARRLAAPLTDPAGITARLGRVETLHDDAVMRLATRELLKKVHDLERLAGRVALGTIAPREVAGLADSLEAIAPIREAIVHEGLAAIRAALDPVPELTALIRERIVADPPIEIGEAPLFREGVDPRLDEIRNGSRAARQWIAALQQKERERTGIGSLKVGFNNVFGYFIEVTRANLAKVPEDYRRKQTTANGERYFTEELKTNEEIILRANERIEEVERALFAELRSTIAGFLPRIQKTGSAVAELDLSASFAETAATRGHVKPVILDQKEAHLRIKAGRHPVVEALLAGEERFVPNETTLEKTARFMILTGPNMAGKSTYIRQVAIIALLAQCGAYVPAAECALAPFDGIFTRIGASDRLARGLSTFMVEMVEAAAILRSATPRSLVVLDEIGRGTSTYDGLSIAWAMVEALAARACLTLFATHYHELTGMVEETPGAFNATVAVKEWGEKIHFLHEIRPGAADRSYGIQVAALAGVPRPVLDRAKEILSRLELGELRSGRSADASDQLSLFDAFESISQGERAALDQLKKIEPDDLAPREAHALLCELKERIGQ